MISRFFGSLFSNTPPSLGIVEQGPFHQAEDELAAVASALDGLRSEIRKAGRRLPGLIWSQLRQIDDTVRSSLRYVQQHGASTEQTILLTAIVNDYLPTPLGAYLALEETARREESEETLVLAGQLKLLMTAAEDLAGDIRSGAASELSVYARFLQDKFGPSLRLDAV